MVATVKFGWVSSGHTAIEKAAVNVLPDSSWKSLLQTRLDGVHQASMAQDVINKGPDHYINLENGDVIGPKLVQDADRTFDGVSAHFTPELQQQLGDRFTREPLEEEPLRQLAPAVYQPSNEEWDGHTNVLNRTWENFDKLVAQLSELSTKKPGSVFAKVRALQKLDKTVGELSHYVADMHQPMHTTGYYTWPMAYVWRSEYGYDTSSSHDFFERALLSTEDLWFWRKNFEADALKKIEKPEKTDKAAMADTFLRSVESGYLTMPDMIASDKAAWDASRNDEEYFNTLKAGWRPVAEARMNESAANLSAMLSLAYKEAGSPDLSALKVSPVANRVVFFLKTLPQRILNFLKKPFVMLGLIARGPQQSGHPEHSPAINAQLE